MVLAAGFAIALRWAVPTARSQTASFILHVAAIATLLLLSSRSMRSPSVLMMPLHPIVPLIEPEFSEEARKAKYQGVVVLAIEVDTSGHPRNLKIVQGLGLGLDEKPLTPLHDGCSVRGFTLESRS